MEHGEEITKAVSPWNGHCSFGTGVFPTAAESVQLATGAALPELSRVIAEIGSYKTAILEVHVWEAFRCKHLDYFRHANSDEELYERRTLT